MDNTLEETGKRVQEHIMTALWLVAAAEYRPGAPVSRPQKLLLKAHVLLTAEKTLDSFMQSVNIVGAVLSGYVNRSDIYAHLDSAYNELNKVLLDFA